MRIEDAKVGAKVFWPGEDSVHGVIVERKGQQTYDAGNTVWVEWSDGQVLWIGVDKLVLVEAASTSTVGMTEEGAVMFLLNLGYTVTKGKV